MTTYCPQTRYAARPDLWLGGEGVRYATREEAEASMEHIRAYREDLLETRVIESSYKPTHVWKDGRRISRSSPTISTSPTNFRGGR